MPKKTTTEEHTPYTEQEDKRRKITAKERKIIKALYKKYKDIRTISILYGVDYYTIQDIVSPAKRLKNNTYKKKKKYRTKELTRIYQARWRVRKKLLGKMPTNKTSEELQIQYNQLTYELEQHKKDDN